ncbi:MAG: AraC family transcriptional regulator [Prevotella sp.]|nr:AraC family transcriptional regulator [Prevotella sp.]
MNKKECKKSDVHPLLQLHDMVEKQGLVVLDNITSMPSYGEAYISPYAIIALCESGVAKAEYDMRPVEFHPHDLCIMKAEHVVNARETSADYKARLIVMSAEFVEKFSHLNIVRYNAHVKYFDHTPACHLTQEQFSKMKEAFTLLKTVSTAGERYRDDMLLNVFHTLIMMRHEFNPIPEDDKLPTGRSIFLRFNEAVIEHYRESREVGYYARMFNLSPKYFSTLIKQETGINAGEWIEHYVTLQAKSLLTRRPDLTIQQAALQLGFGEQASFSRFFRNNVGMSPTEYRKR